MHTIRRICAAAIIALAATAVHAEPAVPLRFEALTTARGLSSSSVSGICQDGAGFLWFATQAGLNRYDGRNFKVFENEPFEQNSLVQNQIQTIFADSDGSLWIGTYGGLSHYVPATDTFTSYVHRSDDPTSLSNNVVVSIARDSAGRLWVGTLDGLNRLDTKSGQFAIYREGDPAQGALPNSVVRAVFKDSTGRLWIGTYGGLSLYDDKSDSFVTWQAGEDSDRSRSRTLHTADLGSNNVMTIVEDPDRHGVLWVGTWGGGLSRFDTETGSAKLFKLPDDRVYVSLVDSAGRLWIGTWGGGLIQFSRQGHSLSVYTAEMRDGIPNDIVYSLYQDRSGVLWIGTNGGGVAKLVDWRNRYTYYRHESGDPTSLPAGKITAMARDAKGRIWVAVYNAGLHRLDPRTGGFTHYRHNDTDSRSLDDDMVNDIFVDHHDRMWVTTNSGIDLYNPATDEFIHPFVGISNFPIKQAVVDRYFEDSRGSVWIGTYTKGLYRFDHDMNSYVHFGTGEPEPRRIANNLIRVIYEDSRGSIWIGTNNGLFRYRYDSDTLMSFVPGKPKHTSISAGSVRDIREGRGGRIYIATMGGGVNVYDPATDRFDYLTTEDGLASNMVLGILETDGRYFFPTQRGVSVYAPSDHGFQTLDESSGLLSNEMTDGRMVGAGGVLYFGSAGGVTVVPQFAALPEGPVPPIVITDLQVLGKRTMEQLTSPGTYREVTLPFRYNTLSIEFAVLDYANPRQNRYSVKLEGADDNWHELTSRDYVTFSGLAPGSYRLRVTGAGSRNNWNRVGLTLPIRVLRPWWATPPAFAGYVLALLTIGLLLVLRDLRARRRAVARSAEHDAQTRRLEERVKERTAEIEAARREAEEATRAKSAFMARMSHEIRTPINGVAGMLTLLRRTPLDTEQRRYVEFARVAADNLYNIVSDVLDFERIMAGRLSVSSAPFSIREALRFVVGIYGSQAADKSVDLFFDADSSVPEIVVGDRTRTVQIVTNLVSNAIKYTDCGTVRIRLTVAAEEAAQTVAGGESAVRLRISVSDTGIGIAADRLDLIFEQFAQLDTGESRQGLGSGLGLSIVKQLCSLMEGDINVTSTPGEGSCFAVTLPFRVSGKGSADDAEPGRESGRASVATIERVAPGTGSHSAASKREEARPSDTAQAASDPTVPADGGNGRPTRTVRILVAEDEGINRLFITTILSGRGFEVRSVGNGADAAALAASEEFDLILMDIGMPVMGGLDAAARIRKSESEKTRRRTPILALTAYAYQSDIESCYAAGMDDFISKPLDESLLFEKIAEWTANERAESGA
ncbi:two-component regulator propeller domain-containing protein [Salinispira pacifica]